MKILIIQLARIGDLLLVVPIIRGLQKKYPGSEISVLCRKSFQEAMMIVLPEIKVLTLDSGQIIRTVSERDYHSSFELFKSEVSKMSEVKFDLIANLSYSPLSSWLTHYFAETSICSAVNVFGYTRHEDGSFNPNDPWSSYWFAQVGIHKNNRLHIISIWEQMLGIEAIIDVKATARKNKIAIHIGASKSSKTLDSWQWSQIIDELHDRFPSVHWILLGNQTEKEKSNEIEKRLMGTKLENLVGATNWQDLQKLFSELSLVIAADSALIHFARLFQTPVFNISLQKEANFWETGPQGNAQFWISVWKDQGSINLSAVISQINSILMNTTADNEVFISEQENDFCWKLIEAIYFGADFPMCGDLEFISYIQHFAEFNSIILQNLSAKGGDQRLLHQGIDRCNEMMDGLGRKNPGVKVYYDYLCGERACIPPGNQDQIKQKMLEIHSHLKSIINPYIITRNEQVNEAV